MLGKVYDFKTKKLKVNALEYAENLFDIHAAIVGGGWTSSQEGPWVHRVGTLYSSPLLISPEALSVNAKITRVSWSWEVENYRPDLKVYLVDVNESPGCLNISRWGKGDTSVFNGRCANHQFKLYFYIDGVGSINPPVRSLQNTLCVDWKNLSKSRCH